MSNAAAADEDTAFVKFWNEVLAPKFIRFKHVLVGGLTRHSEAIFPQLPVHKGDRVLDVGCGFGDTAITLAGMVGPTGYVVGIDCCDAFLEIAQKDADTNKIANIDFRRSDAEIALPVNEYDFVFSRFGTMFFTNPVAAMRNMRLALKPGGRLVYATCSLLREENEQVVEDFLASENGGFTSVDCQSILDSQQIELQTGRYFQVLPDSHQCDGFFAAVLERSADHK